mmetsp:Transcript_18787/g.45136  ORF Transcript_18787/g.45136 Transcript_18787/m.45136 type:complete len:204 (-) Transcript_18787:2076-2687(-)
MYSETLGPGSCPPSPGLAPCAILISSCFPVTKNSGVTPKRPLAIWCTNELALSPFFNPARWGNVGLRPFSSTSDRSVPRTTSSPPSPELDLPPTRFTAMARVSWASRLSAPRLIAPVQNRVMISDMGSTSSMGMDSRSDSKSRRSRMFASGADSRLFLKISYPAAFLGLTPSFSATSLVVAALTFLSSPIASCRSLARSAELA